MMSMNALRIGQFVVVGMVLGWAGTASAKEPVREPNQHVSTDLISSGQTPVYVGTYTRGTSKGIYLLSSGPRQRRC